MTKETGVSAARMRVIAGLAIAGVSARRYGTQIDFGLTYMGLAFWKDGQVKCHGMVVHINHAIARAACRSCRANFGDLLLLSAYFQFDLMGGNFNAFNYLYTRQVVNR